MRERNQVKAIFGNAKMVDKILEHETAVKTIAVVYIYRFSSTNNNNKFENVSRICWPYF